MNEDINHLDGKSCIFAELLGETLRPGGLDLTAHVAEIAGIQATQQVLDIGCGKGTTAAFLAQKYSCRVAGIDLSERMILSSQAKAAERNFADQVSFLVADGEYLPFGDASFDVVISECTFSLMPDQNKAASDIRRVLKPQGRFVLTDIILRGKVDPNLQRQIAFPCCLASSGSIEECLQLFKQSGFDSYYIEDQSERLEEIGFELGMAIEDLDRFPVQALDGPCRRKGRSSSATSSKQLWDFLKQGKPGYAVIIMNKT